ncbi:hypothetical protein ADL15_22115 [Actinoplanes awajinensis subsp. mycoplanecinus]|uniref:Bacterial transcriptional activator domain-containing protein n=2 Tax=Actinoplanes awajinensis TaxID=135946 RepID=A0A101JR53_9ACTN|nr:hypothetical protein ADL15_22115 [Actinoplanes awajinensis subsp. mycoplanecinus]
MFAAARTLIVVLAVLTGPPVLMITAAGAPWPDHVPSAEQVQQWLDAPLADRYLAATGWALGWLVWGLVAAGVVALAITRARSRDWQRSWERICFYLPGPMQGLAATLLGTAAVAGAGTALPAHAASPAPTTTLDDQPPPGAHTPRHDRVPDRPATVAVSMTARGGHDSRTVTVHRGDTLWDIADERLGKPQQWTKIFHLNADRYDMRGGDRILPGWKLALPPVPAKEQPHHQQPRPQQPSDTGAHTPAPDQPPGSTVTATPTRPSAPTGTPANTGTGNPGNDGVTDTSAPTEQATPAPSESRTTADDGKPASARTAPPGVSLASGSWMDLGLATAVAGAVALLWAHRRRRYTRRPVSVDLRLQDPDLAALPPVVTQIRRQLRNAATSPSQRPDNDEAAGLGATALDTDDADGREPVDETSPAGGHGVAEESQEELSAVRPVVPTLTNPVLTVWPSSGLGLTGPGAEAAARGLLVAAIADRSPDEPHGQVVMPSSTAVTLFGAAAVALPRTPQLTITDDLADALTLLEEQTLHRSRLAYAHEVDTIAAMRAADPVEESTPPILLLTDTASPHERTRIAALLAQGQRLDIHGVLLGDWPDGDTARVETDGTTSPDGGSRHGRHPADIGRLTVLTPAETLAVIATLAEAHTGRPQPQLPAEPPPVGIMHREDEAGLVLSALADLGSATAAAIAAHTGLAFPTATTKLIRWEHSGHAETFRADTGQTLWRLTAAGSASLELTTDLAENEPAGPDEPTSTTPAIASTLPASTDPGLGENDSETPATATHAARTGGRVTVDVLGAPEIATGALDRLPRRKAMELLVYLAVHDGSATTEQILDDLLPDAPVSKAPQRLHTYVSDLRNVMRRAAGPGTYLTHPQRRYVLNADLIDIDLWRMRTAIRDAGHTTEAPRRIAALRRAVAVYRGPLADGAGYEWAEPYREAIRKQALDAHLDLADALTDPRERIQVLEAAIAHSPYSEEVYQQAMRARADLNDINAIRSLRRAVGRAMAAIDAEASDETIRLSDELIADVERRQLPPAY